MNKKIFYWYIGGVFFTLFLGSFLHFIYELSGFLKPVAIMGAVNESTWEHLKIGFWPAFIFAVIEYFRYGRKNKNFYFAKAINLLTIPIFITVLFYGYTLFMSHNLFLDIFIFVLSIVIAYFFSYKIMVSQKDFSGYKNLAILIIVIELTTFSLLSYFPLENFLFLDSLTGSYGIQ